MPNLVDHILAVVLVFLIPPRAWFSFRTLRRSSDSERPRTRRRIYSAALITQWALAGAVVTQWLVTGRAWRLLGVAPVLTPGGAGIAVGLAIVILLIARQLRRAGDRSDVFDRARARLAHVEALVPHSRAELRLFRFVAVTAGICEELLFRGFLIWYLAQYTGILQAALLSSVAFGIGHLYQGLRYVALTAMVGLFFAAVYLFAGFLLLPMLIHALMDLYSGWMGYRVFGTPPSGDVPPGQDPPGAAHREARA